MVPECSMHAQKLLRDQEGSLAQDAAMTSVLVQLTSQVCSSMSELAAMLADAIAASLPSSVASGDTWAYHADTGNAVNFSCLQCTSHSRQIMLLH